MRKYFPILLIGWTVMIVVTLLINLYILRQNSEVLVQAKSEAFFKLLVTVRQWNANHGLVYVPVTKTMHPNPYLIHRRRDAVTNYGDSLTLVNPAFMTRQVAELLGQNDYTSFHITSLNPIRPANKADEWETKALKTFSKVDDSYFEKTKAGDSVIFRYMAPLIVGQSCLACHAAQGYKLGDIRGGISVNTTYHKEYPTPTQANANKIIIIYAVIYLLGVFVFLYLRSLLKRHNLELEAKNKELQDMNAAKDKFFSVIAHDLKTPAANIESLSQTLKEKYDDLSKEDRINCVDMLVESARTHNDLLNTMLDLSRLRLGSKQYLPERLDVCKLAEDVLEQTKLQAQQKRIVIINQANECYAKADKNMVTTVLRNIVVNGIKFTCPGGQITIRAEYTGATIVVSVADTGIGINDNMKNRIFEVDYNKSTAGTANESGTGLGLVLCKEYVERNGGKIWVESEVGLGSTFFFTLPIYR